ncbi:hypothetical protein [Chelatococcus reniformis]|uniref:Uncharacterized protein n=1 Tax=Chelatococcus reniformis TaxID=1494448 RepID=A0A916XET3_9HYPH|nr:hypothetical protein [Chelatococcus reniformis]GGC65142.1 hypothetical protein GCM10010994_24670 [Chelatococcus reniformis]
MSDCCSLPQTSLLGPVPPRTPGRPDAQVPNDLADGPVKYARVPHIYFYEAAPQDHAGFGLLDLEISLQRRRDGPARVELYCIGDGYQSGHGSSGGSPLVIELRAGERVVAAVRWPYPDVLNGHMDPMTFEAAVDLSEADFAAIDAIWIPPARALVEAELA